MTNLDPILLFLTLGDHNDSVGKSGHQALAGCPNCLLEPRGLLQGTGDEFEKVQSFSAKGTGPWGRKNTPRGARVKDNIFDSLTLCQAWAAFVWKPLSRLRIPEGDVC